MRRATSCWCAPGTGRFWGDDGADHAKIAEHDSAGPDLEATKWLVDDNGAIMVGSDTSGYEVNPPPGSPGTGIPVHRYLLVDQGVHLGEFHYLEGLSQARAYTFCYVAVGQQDQRSRRGLRLAAAGIALAGSESAVARATDSFPSGRIRVVLRIDVYMIGNRANRGLGCATRSNRAGVIRGRELSRGRRDRAGQFGRDLESVCGRGESWRRPNRVSFAGGFMMTSRRRSAIRR